MKIINDLIPESVAYALGWTVLHSLWQGIIIALLLFFALGLLKNKKSKWQYEASCFALFSVLVTALATFIYYLDDALTGSHLVAEQFLPKANGTTLSVAEVTGAASVSMFETCLPWVVSFWLVGVGVLTIRLFAGFFFLQHLRKYSVGVKGVYTQKIKELRQSMGIRRSVQLAESVYSNAPATFGFFKPIIIFPVGMLNQLSLAETEAVLAHELAHIFRNDFLQNILVSIIEILFYYHPAVWWISSQIQEQRENCCDDMALQICGDSVGYVKALVKLEDLKTQTTPVLAMPFSGRKKTLLFRVSRILNQGQPKSNFIEKITATCLVLMFIFGITLSAENREHLVAKQNDVDIKIGVTTVIEEDDQESGKVVQVMVEKENPESKKEALQDALSNGAKGVCQKTVAIAEKPDTIPGTTKRFSVLDLDAEGRKILMEIRNDEMVKLIVDGKEIAKEDYDLYKDATGFVMKNVEQTYEDGTLQEDPNRVIFREYNNGNTEVLIGGAIDESENVKVFVKEDGGIIINGEEIDLPEDVFVIDVPEIDFGALDIAHLDMAELEGLLADGNSFEAMLDQLELDESINFENLTKELEVELLALKERLQEDKAWQEKLFESTKNEMANELRHLEMQKELHDEKLKEQHEKIQETHLRIQREHLREQERHMELHEKYLREHETHLRELEEKRERDDEVIHLFEQELLKDGLIDDPVNYSFSIKKKRMEVNGKKQPANVRKKYLSLYEKITGQRMEGDNGFRVTKNG